MKGLLLSILFSATFGHTAFADEVVDCRKVKDRMVLFCDSLVDQCEYIRNCLHRRDTCVEKAPENQQECSRLSKCVAKIADQLPGREKCEYKWVEGNNKNLCLVDKSIFFMEEACPGNIDGLISSLAYGLRSTVDSKFDCSTTPKLYKKKLESCQEYRETFEKECMVADSAEDRALLAETTPKLCHEYKDFDRIPAGAFYLEAEGVDEFSSNRGFKGYQNVVPAGRGYRGKERALAR